MKQSLMTHVARQTANDSNSSTRANCLNELKMKQFPVGKGIYIEIKTYRDTANIFKILAPIVNDDT